MKKLFFRKILAWTAILLVLSIAASAGAEGSLRRFYEAGEDLLFHTSNVSCEGKAVFSLNGARFKTAEFRYIQVGTRSFQDLLLLTPRKDGTERESGYTIFDENGSVIVMERFFPGTYQRRTANPSSTIMKTSVYLNQLLALGGDVADEAEKALGDMLQVSAEEDGGTSMKLTLTSADMPPLAQSALNLFWDYVIKRFYYLDYDTCPTTGYATFTDYGTIFEGIRFVTAGVALQKADLDLSLDSAGRVNGIGGSLSLELTTRAGEKSILDVEFLFAASSYGSSSIKAFKPENYNVVRVDDPWY